MFANHVAVMLLDIFKMIEVIKLNTVIEGLRLPAGGSSPMRS